MVETCSFGGRVRNAGRNENSFALEFAIREFEGHGSVRQSDIANCVIRASDIQRAWEAETERRHAPRVSVSTASGESRIEARYRKRREELTRKAFEQFQSRVEKLRQIIFGKQEPPFSNLLDAIEWIQAHAITENRVLMDTSFKLNKFGDNCPLAVERLYGSIKELILIVDSGLKSIESLWGRDDKADVSRLNSLGYEEIERLEIPPGNLYFKWFFRSDSPLETIWEFVRVAQEETGCDSTAALILLLFGIPFQVFPLSISVSSEPEPLRKDIDPALLKAAQLAGWSLGEPLTHWDLTIVLRGAGPLSAIKWEDLRMAWREIQHNQKMESLESLIASKGGVPRSGKMEFWRQIAELCGAPSGRAARMRYRRACQREIDID